MQRYEFQRNKTPLQQAAERVDLKDMQINPSSKAALTHKVLKHTVLTKLMSPKILMSKVLTSPGEG